MPAPDLIPAHVLSTTVARNRLTTPRRHLTLVAPEQPPPGCVVPTRSGTSIAQVQDTDDYTGAISGLHVDAIRIGSGITPSRVVDVTGERVTVTTCEIGFPIVTHSHVPKHQIVVAYMIQACQASRWCAVPLRPHTVMIYGPGAEHVAINQPGLAFTFGVTELDLLAELADQTNTHIKIPSTGSVQQFPISTTTRALGDALHNFTYTGFIDQPLKPARNRVLQSLVTLLATNQPQHHIGTARGVDSRDIVRECVEYATTTQRIPSLRELCTAAKVSERRLRTAFTDEFDRPPTRFFRDWALGQANRRLRQAHPNQLTVTEVAMELGFAHLGRFAGHYRHLYGEPPSTTLHNPTPLAG